MRALLFLAAVLTSSAASAQFYYKDIIGTAETAEMIRNYRKANVSRVILTSYDGNNTRTDAFYAEHQFSTADQTLKTISRSDFTAPSVLISYVDGSGRVTKTVDSSDAVVSVTSYTYNSAGQLVSAGSSSADSMNTANESEEHVWQYAGTRPVRMLRIKNKVDTTYVELKHDEKGNVIEEQATRKGVRSEPIYYYYDDNNRLTDIVRYNARANRLLPEYMFEYSNTNQVIQKITVPANSDQYLIWRYKYDDNGLKVKEAIYNKQKQLTGTIEYRYSFASN
ncbi:MAG TPA: hypothetical protein VFZ78_08385 [Flavisolibacter sp.]